MARSFRSHFKWGGVRVWPRGEVLTVGVHAKEDTFVKRPPLPKK
jgi:hypothetical protein